MNKSYNVIAGTSLERIAALSDGLFAIAMTLIVLEIHLPGRAAIQTETALWHALGALAPQMVTYLLSFLTLGIFWVGQQTQLSHLTRADIHLTWIQFAFLAAVALMPFSTSLLAEFITFRLALIAYWVNILLLGILVYASWRYAGRAGLIKEELPPEVTKLIERRILVAQSLYAFGAALCLLNTYWSLGFIVLVQLNYALALRVRLLSKLTA